MTLKDPNKRSDGKPRKRAPHKGEGAKPFELDYGLIKKLAAIQCTNAEIATVLGISEQTVSYRKKNDAKFAEALGLGIAEGRVGLRRMQFQAAEKGNASLLIWLGKQYLGQTDTMNIKNSVTLERDRELAKKAVENRPELLHDIFAAAGLVEPMAN